MIAVPLLCYRSVGIGDIYSQQFRSVGRVEFPCARLCGVSGGRSCIGALDWCMRQCERGSGMHGEIDDCAEKNGALLRARCAAVVQVESSTWCGVASTRRTASHVRMAWRGWGYYVVGWLGSVVYNVFLVSVIELSILLTDASSSAGPVAGGGALQGLTDAVPGASLSRRGQLASARRGQPQNYLTLYRAAVCCGGLRQADGVS